MSAAVGTALLLLLSALWRPLTPLCTLLQLPPRAPVVLATTALLYGAVRRRWALLCVVGRLRTLLNAAPAGPQKPPQHASDQRGAKATSRWRGGRNS